MFYNEILCGNLKEPGKSVYADMYEHEVILSGKEQGAE